MYFRKRKRTAGERREMPKRDEICLFPILFVLHFATPSLHNPFHPSPRHPLPIPSGLVFSKYLALVSLCSPFPSHRNDSTQPSALVRPKDSTLPVDTLPHPIRLQCLPIQIPRRHLRRCRLDASRTGTPTDIVLPPYSAWPLNKMWMLRMTWPEVCICSTLFLPSTAVLNATVSAKAFARPQSSYLNTVQEELRLGARCTLPRSKDSSAYPESYGS
jgi:hypothetical protein